MHKREAYRFTFEVLQEAFNGLALTVPADAECAEELAEALGVDGEYLVVYSTDRLELLTLTLPQELERPGDQERIVRSVVAHQLSRHDDCQAVLETLVAERDDAVVGLEDARAHCINDLIDDGDDDVYVVIEPVLDRLRPRPATPRPRLELGSCAFCESDEHLDNCPVEARRALVEARRDHEIRSHRHCAEIADELWHQIDAMYSHIDEVARRLTEWAYELECRGVHLDGAMRAVHFNDAIDLLSWDAVEGCDDLGSPTSYTAELIPPPTDLDYCRGSHHSSPHRGPCREYLL